jgi:hypothetical protein
VDLSPIHVNQILSVVQLIVVVGGGFYLFGRLGARLDALTEAIVLLRHTLEGHDRRIRNLEMRN